MWLPGIWRRLRFSLNFLPWFSPESVPATPSKLQKLGWRTALTVGDQVWDHLRNLQLHKSMRHGFATTPFVSLFQCLTLFMRKKLFLISSLNLFSFSSCLLSHPPAVQPCEKSGFTFLVMSLQALKDTVKPTPKPCPLQAAAVQLAQPLLRGQVFPPWISWWSFVEVSSISPCLNQNCYCFCSQVLGTFMAS